MGLPVQRVLVSKKGAETLTITESYSKITIDGKLDPKTFELPN